jgi:vitamin B12 transporter
LTSFVVALADPPRLTETLVVTAERIEQPWRESTAAVTVVRREDLARLPAETLAGALRLVPGLQLIAVNPGAPPMIASRGFFGAGEVEYLQLLIDGVPAADVESGLADWRSIPIEAIDRIEILRGPGSSLFGDTALGGVVQVFRRPMPHASLSYASFGTARLSAGIARDGLSAGVSTMRSDGFREHSASREIFGNVGLERGAWRVSLDASDRDREDPGAASCGACPSDPLFAGDREDARRVRASLRYRGRFELVVHAQQRKSEQTRTLLLAPGFGDRATREIDAFTLGTSLGKTIEARRGTLAGGVDLAYESLASDYRVVRGGGRRLRGAAFLSGEWRVTPAIRLAAGGRWDSIGDSFEGTEKGDSAFSPRVGASVDFGAASAFLQLSRAFKAPTLDQRFDQRPIAGFTISNPALSAQRAKNIEAGLRGEEWEIAAYHLVVDDEIDFDVNTFRYANIGRSRHRGIEAMARPGRFRASYAWTRVEKLEGEDRGRQLKNIAEHVVRAGVSLGPVHLDVEHSAGRWLDDANRFPLDDATVVDLRVIKALGPVTATIEATNLFDERHAPLGFALGDTPFYYPAAGRSLALSLTWKGDPR